MARATDILTDRGLRSAKLIAQVRNRFAHRLEVSTFDHLLVARIIDRMDSYRSIELKPEMIYNIDRENLTRREKFVLLAKSLYFDIDRGISPVGWVVEGDDLAEEEFPAAPNALPVKSDQAPEQMIHWRFLSKGIPYPPAQSPSEGDPTS